MSDLLLRLRKLIFRRRAESDLNEELALHIELETRKNVASGFPYEEARRRALIHFNGAERVREECREAAAFQFLEGLLKDFRYAVRSLSRAPGFTIAAVATVSLGLGLNTAVFTLFNTYLLRPIAVSDPHSLHTIAWTDAKERTHRFTWLDFTSFRQSATSFSDVLGLINVVGRFASRPVHIQLVTGNYFQMLGVKMFAGRPLLPADAAEPGAESVVVLSHRAWESKLASDPHIVGKNIVLRGHSLTVVGIADSSFSGLGEVPVDFWSPITISNLLEGGPGLFTPEQPERILLVGRLRINVGIRTAESEVLTWARRVSADRAQPELPVTASVQSAATRIRLIPKVFAALAPVLAAFALLLLIVCANVANMTLARTLSRQRETGIRLTLGASRWQLARQIFAESLMLVLPSAAAGLLLSNLAIEAGIRLMLATLPTEYAGFMTFPPLESDFRVFGFILVIAVVSAILFGLAPALEAARTGSVHTLREQSQKDRPSARLRNSLVIGQIAVSVLLLTCAGVLLRGGRTLESLDPGIRAQGVIGFEAIDKPASQLVNELKRDQRFSSVATALQMPLDGPLRHVPITMPNNTGSMMVGYNAVSPEFFSLLQIPLLQGRHFTPSEAAAGDGVAIVSRATAARLWPDASAVGQTIQIAPEPMDRDRTPIFRTVQIIGVAGNITHGWLGFGNDVSCLYMPVTPKDAAAVLLLSRADAEGTRRSLEREFEDKLPGGSPQIHVLSSVVQAQMYPVRAAYAIALFLGALALLLTLSALYGVLSYLVAQRTKEIGIRIALGARQQSVIRMVLSDMARLTGAGVAIGLMLALIASTILSSLITLMNVYELTAFLGSAVVVTIACLVASYFPARRAGRMDPLTALRVD